MPTHERSAVMARGYRGFSYCGLQAEFEGVKKKFCSHIKTFNCPRRDHPRELDAQLHIDAFSDVWREDYF